MHFESRKIDKFYVNYKLYVHSAHTIDANEECALCNHDSHKHTHTPYSALSKLEAQSHLPFALADGILAKEENDDQMGNLNGRSANLTTIRVVDALCITTSEY